MPKRPSATAVIVTALEVETRAVLRQLGRYDVETVSGTGFFKGLFEGWEVAVVEAGPGNAGAAAIAVRALEHYKPQVALFVGVAGGVKDVAIGDVVVATKVYGYESGKDTAKGFQPRPDVQNTAHALEQRARVIRQGNDWKSRLDPAVKHADPAFFVAPIAAGEKVVASKKAVTATLIKDHYGDAIAVEMEGSGFLKGVHINHPTQGAVIRGISDLLSGKANADKAGSQQRAADAASAAAFEILSGLDGGHDRTRKAKPTFLRTASTFSKGSYFTQGEVLAEVGVPDVDQVRFGFVGAPDGYMRIVPMERREKPLTLSSLHANVNQSEMIRATGHGGLSTLNGYGAIYYDPAGSYPMGPAPLRWATQTFQNGELWSLTDTLIVRERGWRPADIPLPLIPVLTLEQGFHRALHKSLPFAVAHLGLTFPCEVELGLLNMRGAHLGVDQRNIRGPIQFDEAIVQIELGSADAAEIDAALLAFFEEIFDKTGSRRPEGLNRFPPGPPRS